MAISIADKWQKLCFTVIAQTKLFGAAD